MKHLKTTSLTLLMALATLFYGCENDAPLDTFEGATLLDASYVSGAPCDNSTNPACAFLLPMDYEAAAPLIAARALSQCPYGASCIFTGEPTTIDGEDWCPNEIQSASCGKKLALYYDLRSVLTAEELNSMVCLLTEQIRHEEFVLKNKIESLVVSTGTHPVGGLTYYYFVASVKFTQIDPKIPAPCQ